jgi:BT1 family
LKPFAGILTDAAFPLFGNRRKSYILISAVLAALSWLALIVTAHEYRYLLSVAIVINAFMVIASTAVGGYMVETAQATSGSGRLTAIRQFIQQACLVINGPAAGYLASIAFGWTAAACGAIMFLLVPITILFLRERRQGLDSREGLDNAKRQLVNIATARTMWAAAGLMALFYIAPGFATALFYKQQNELHLSTQTQGFLGLIAGICGILAAVGYGILCRRLNLRTLLIWMSKAVCPTFCSARCTSFPGSRARKRPTWLQWRRSSFRRCGAAARTPANSPRCSRPRVRCPRQSHPAWC